ncbi:MAG: alpha/beta fold hydrolase [Chloroflexota bacterium]|nr:MAG: alpha/beta fold hydrolase [Chloroflexota bacterium]
MPTLAELVSTRTRDDVLLHGALYEPTVPATTAALLVHGGWGNFYMGLGRFLPAALATTGITCLSLNTRGHDYGTVADREPCIGLMREQFEDCPKDIAAGLAFLKERGYKQLIIIAHSFGASKTIYTHVMEPDPLVRTLILCSTATVMSESAKHFIDVPYDEVVQETTRLVESGQGERFVIPRHEGPIPVVATARTFLSIWGPDTAAESRKWIAQLRAPTLFVVGDRDQPHRERTKALFQLAEKAEPRELVILPKGDHDYLGVEEPLQDAVLAWLDKLGLH